MLGIVYIVEQGLLEQQALLLQKSIERFVAPFSEVQSFACCVRKNHQPAASTIESLKAHGATYLFADLNQSYDYFPLCNGIFATREIEQVQKNLAACLLVDTDTVFVNALDDKLLNQHSMLIRPVDNVGIGSKGQNDPNDEFWQKAFAQFATNPPPASMETTVDRCKIRPYYNSGFVFAQKQTAFFSRWYDDFHQLMDSKVRTQKRASRHQVDYGFIEQMSISITVDRLGLTPQVPSIQYNYPLPFRPRLQNNPAQNIDLSALVHLHYHRWFQHPGFLSHVFSEADQETDAYQWLDKNLPFEPELSGPFKC